MFQWHKWLSAILLVLLWMFIWIVIRWAFIMEHHEISSYDFTNQNAIIWTFLFLYSIVYGNRKPMVNNSLKHRNFCVLFLVFFFNNNVGFTVCLSDAHIVNYQKFVRYDRIEKIYFVLLHVQQISIFILIVFIFSLWKLDDFRIL